MSKTEYAWVIQRDDGMYFCGWDLKNTACFTENIYIKQFVILGVSLNFHQQQKGLVELELLHITYKTADQSR